MFLWATKYGLTSQSVRASARKTDRLNEDVPLSYQSTGQSIVLWEIRQAIQSKRQKVKSLSFRASRLADQKCPPKWWSLARNLCRLKGQSSNFAEDLFKVSRDTFHFPWTRKFSFSACRVVQGEAKTPKIMGCCRAIFAFLHALKIGTFRGKWTLEWVFKTSQFFRLALYFLINSKLAFFFACFWTMPNGNCKKNLI